MNDPRPRDEKLRVPASLLSTDGAAVAGVGLGGLIAGAIGDIAGPLPGIGLVAPLVGMVGIRKVQASTDYRPARREQLTRWA